MSRYVTEVARAVVLWRLEKTKCYLLSLLPYELCQPYCQTDKQIDLHSAVVDTLFDSSLFPIYLRCNQYFSPVLLPINVICRLQLLNQTVFLAPEFNI